MSGSTLIASVATKDWLAWQPQRSGLWPLSVLHSTFLLDQRACETEQKRPSSMEYSIVHLSDLHFKNDVENRFRIEKLREDLVKQRLGPKTITAFTGDLVQSGEQEQYDVLFDILLAPLIEADHHIAIVPGNHDIQRHLADKEAAARFLNDRASSYLFSGSSLILSPFGTNPDGPLANYRALEALFSPYIEQSFYGYVKQVGDVYIVGMNSTWLSHQRDGNDSDRGKLRVEPHILSEYVKNLPTEGFRVLLLHHPFDWLEEVTRDAVTSIAAENFDLVLYGHVHTADMTQLVRKKSGAGLIQSPPLRADWSKGTNGYAIIRCNTRSKASEITYRSYSKSQRLFVVGEDFAQGGTTYVKESDRQFFQKTPSLSALTQKFISGMPHDFVDWHRRNVRAKSNYIESFIIPQIQKVAYDDNEQWLEPAVPLSTLFEESSRDQFVIAPADSGLSTSAFLTLKGLAEKVADTGVLPVFFDAGEASVNKASILRSMVQTCLTHFTTSEMEHLAQSGSVRLIVDGLNLSNAEHFNNFRRTMKRFFPRVPITTFVRTEKVGQAISSADYPTMSPIEDDIYELGELGVQQIREVISMHRQNIKDDTIIDRLANHAIDSLSQINEPIFPSTVAVLVETLVQDHDFRPINKARLLDRYVECLLGRFELEDVREGTFSSHDKIEFLSFVARQILERDNGGLAHTEWQQVISDYETNYLIELPRGLLQEFEEKGLLVSEGGRITFRADYLFSYFVARQMKSDTVFAKSITTDEGLFKHHAEIVFYGELEGTDTGAVLDQIYKQVDRLEELLLEQYSRDGIDLTSEWLESTKDDPHEIVEAFQELAEFDSTDPDPEVADLRNNQRLANVLRRRGISRRREVSELEAKLLVAMKLYAQLIRNALHIPAPDKLRHLQKLYEAAEIWVGFMSAARSHIGSSPVTVAGGVRFINYGAAIDRAKSISDFKFNAPNSVSRILADSVKNPQLSVALRTVLPKLSEMGALFAREALLILPAKDNQQAYLDSIKASSDKTLLTASMRALKREYLSSGRNSDVRTHSAGIVDGIRKAVGDRALGDPNSLNKQRLLRDMKAAAAEKKRRSTRD
ncbi:metallophosphoesterase [Paracoccus niistensis]|uniref:Metallophosphoesterase n=1 Tax=Paracoccus niistensis TaxID=632935 RepID=A0ABV6I858_9RHOB